jgi:hypothetical protein
MTTLLQSCFCCPASLKEIFLAASHWTGYGAYRRRKRTKRAQIDTKLCGSNRIQLRFWRRSDSFSKHICSATARESLKFPLLSCDGAPFSSLKRWAFHMWTPEGEISRCRNQGCHISHTVWTHTALNLKPRSLYGKEVKRSEMIWNDLNM